MSVSSSSAAARARATVTAEAPGPAVAHPPHQPSTTGFFTPSEPLFGANYVITVLPHTVDWTSGSGTGDAHDLAQHQVARRRTALEAKIINRQPSILFQETNYQHVLITRSERRELPISHKSLLPAARCPLLAACSLPAALPAPLRR
jgi:hypothetical protein